MKDKKQIMLDEISKESEIVIATAYLYAKNYVTYGEDITKAWTIAVQQQAILEKAYTKGYADALAMNMLMHGEGGNRDDSD